MSNLKAFAEARQKADDEEIEAYEAAQRGEQELQEELNTPVVDSEEESWKKRYGDHRRLLARKEQQWKKEFETLKTKYEQALNSKDTPLPVTKEELEQYIRDYPKVGSLINAIVAEQLDQRLADTQDRLARIDELEDERAFENAKKQLAKREPDFYGDSNGLLPNGQPAIAHRAEFYEWLDSKQDTGDAWVIDAIGTSNNVGQAIAAILLWKKETGFTSEKSTKSKSKRKSNLDAAASVRTSGKPTVSEPRGDFDFKESDVDRMSEREYSEHEKAIDKAIREGRFLYDMSA